MFLHEHYFHKILKRGALYMERQIHFDIKQILYQISGEVVSIENCRQVVREIREVFPEKGKRLVIEFDKNAYITGSFIGFLINIIRFVRENGGEISIVSKQKEISEILQLTGISQLVKVTWADAGVLL